MTASLQAPTRRRRAGILARGTRFLRTPGQKQKAKNRTLKGCRGSLTPLRGAGVNRVFFPGGTQKTRTPGYVPGTAPRCKVTESAQSISDCVQRLIVKMGYLLRPERL